MTGSASARAARCIADVVGTPVSEVSAAGRQHRWSHWRAILADGRPVFAKVADAPVAGVFEAEAHGLRWLAEAGGVPFPEVLGVGPTALVVSWLRAGTPDRAAARRFGRDLAELHRAGVPGFGAAWPGYIASLPLPSDDLPGQGWPRWYAERRLAPYLRRAADAGTLPPSDVTLVEAVIERIAELAGPAESPSRIHGDCWSGNLVWSGGRGWLVDPAAHGGHRETDLAMLDLFGAPFGDQILAGYQEVAPLAEGWQARVPLHQLHPLLVHVCLFGSSYRERLRLAARGALAR